MLPLVALESTVIAHGLPHPHNLETAHRLEAVVREVGAHPRTVAVLGGVPVVGLTADQLAHLATAPDVRKVSLRDLPVAMARHEDGATTVAATLWLAHREGVAVFATGGIGGVHRALGGAASFDVSNDLHVLGQVPMVVVCAGAKAILDLPATREVLETVGVTVVGYGTNEMPAFYSRTSGLPVDVRCDTPEEVAALAQRRRQLQIPGAVLVTVPPPEATALPPEVVQPAIDQALAEAEAQGLRSAALTPFLLRRIATLTDGRALATNVALLEQNARIAASIARALTAQERPAPWEPRPL
ncbi:MAG: pseudouridine-5'-phosphate glycosidase [Bacteroidota bacterium]